MINTNSTRIGSSARSGRIKRAASTAAQASKLGVSETKSKLDLIALHLLLRERARRRFALRQRAE